MSNFGLIKLIKHLNFPQFRNTLLINSNRLLSSEASPPVTETQLKTLLQQRFANAKEIKVEDVSGGCGAMFDIYVESTEFKGLSIVKQHKAITETLKDQIKQIHGLRIETKTSA